MQGSFEDIYNKLYPSISHDIDYITSSLNNYDNYEIIESNDTNDDVDYINNISNKLIMFDIHQYLEKIEKSLNNDSKRIEQFKLDFKRSELYLNGKYTRGEDYFLSYIKKNINYLTNFKNMKMYDIILLLCNQSSFVFPFVLMNNIYSNPTKGIYVTSNNIQYFINHNKESLTIELIGIFNIKNINIDKIIGSVQIATKFDIEFDRFKKSYKFPKLGMIYWDSK
ncbi:hypothetical protein Indivirus_1_50 [Indivirus ILV1]|uniref:Uncharacterized protein n=1 Tax=Indivirus ILV1 TaxID=1977633 RepID=A0A1V0SCI5_9VIRU|nr:hypothetical protein Indivirus_1_50 [Indivirus ILV1]